MCLIKQRAIAYIVICTILAPFVKALDSQLACEVLVTFILLHNAALIIEHDSLVAQGHGIRANLPEYCFLKVASAYDWKYRYLLTLVAIQRLFANEANVNE